MTKHTGQPSPYSDTPVTSIADAAERRRPLSVAEIRLALARTEAVLADCREQIRHNEALLSLLETASKKDDE